MRDGRLTRWVRRVKTRVSTLAPVQYAVGASIALAVASTGAVALYRTYDYVQHDNEFCRSCHLMQVPFERFAASKHRTLSCKACHHPTMVQRTKMALKQVIEWPDSIAGHAVVPNERCERCHVASDSGQWRQVGGTAGHRVHLESRDPALEDVQCITCHSVGVHAFAPTDAVCGRAGCHESVEVVLGGMGDLEVHCQVCHDFMRKAPRRGGGPGGKRDAPLLAPREKQCLQCHDMQQLMSIAPEDEPHGAVCGTCHDAHAQQAGRDALRSCTASGCHENPASFSNLHHRWRSIELANCTRCHRAHDFRIDEDDCTKCHASVLRDTPTTSAPQPAAPAALPFVDSPEWPRAVHGPSVGPSAEEETGLPEAWLMTRAVATARVRPLPVEPQRQQRAFDHARHRSVPCRQCHTSERAVAGSGPAWCESCHHGGRNVQSCARCHAAVLAAPKTVESSMRLPGGTASRSLAFRHVAHEGLGCAGCHGTPPRRIAKAPCAECHRENHGRMTACLGCHPRPPAWAHEPGVVHAGCGGAAVCHSSVPDGVSPERPSVCLLCHPDYPKEGPLPPLPLREVGRDTTMQPRLLARRPLRFMTEAGAE